MKRGFVLLAVGLSLAGCGDVFGSSLSRFTTYVGMGKIGNSADVWLVKGTTPDDRVALIFGYVDDYSACLDIANALNATYTQAQYSCRPAN